MMIQMRFAVRVRLELVQESEVSSTCSYYMWFWKLWEMIIILMKSREENERKNSEDELGPVSSSSVFGEIIERERTGAETEIKLD